MFEFVKVMSKVLPVPFLSGHGAEGNKTDSSEIDGTAV